MVFFEFRMMGGFEVGGGWTALRCVSLFIFGGAK